MKTTRTSCFETNSSSTHSITFDVKDTDVEFSSCEIMADSFGWEWRKFNDFRTKASYFWSLVYDEYGRKLRPELYARLMRLSKKHGIVFTTPTADKYLYPGVDHGHEHYEKFVSQFPMIATDEGLWEFLTNKAYYICLGNDNDIAPPNFRQTQNQKRKHSKVLTIADDERTRLYFDEDASGIGNIIETAIDYYFQILRPREYTQFPEIKSIGDKFIEVDVCKYDYNNPRRESIKKVLSTEQIKYTLQDNETAA
jgi:hypothetical protein